MFFYLIKWQSMKKFGEGVGMGGKISMVCISDDGHIPARYDTKTS
jgi:hypothetical protein